MQTAIQRTPIITRHKITYGNYHSKTKYEAASDIVALSNPTTTRSILTKLQI